MGFRNLRELLEDRAEKSPDDIFLAFYGDYISFGEINRRVNRCANAMLKLGVKKGEVVNIHLFNCPDHLVICLAAFKIGAVACPVNFQFKPEELQYQVGDSRGVLVFTESALAGVTAAVRETLPTVRAVVEIGDEVQPGNLDFRGLVANETEVLPPMDIFPDDDCIILYTSGTTGPAKGALLTHGNFLYMTEAVTGLLGAFYPDDSFKSTRLIFLPMFHVNPLMHNLLAIWRGDRNVLMRKFSVSEFGPLVEQERPDYFFGVPKVFKVLLEARDTIQKHDLSSIKLATCGAAPMPPETITAFQEDYGIEIMEGYGLTEATFASTMNPPVGVRKVGSVGPAIAGQTVGIMSDDGNLLGPNEVGEIVIGGPSLMKEYFGKEEETHKVLRDGWLYTGDVGRMDDDGYFYVVDRIKDMIIKGGENISPKEIEDVIIELKDVHDVAVIGVPDSMSGEDVKAFIVPRIGSGLTADDVTAHCRARLSDYKAPRDIEFVLGIPSSAMGKALKRKLRDGEGIVSMSEKVDPIPLDFVWQVMVSRFNPEKAEDWRARVGYEVFGGTTGAVTFVIGDGRMEVVEGRDPEATVVIRMTDIAMNRIIEGKMDMLTGMNSGLIQVEGNEADLAMFGEVMA